MAKRKQKTEPEETEDLEDLEDLDIEDLADETEDVEDEEEGDEDEAPRKKSKKARARKESDTIGSADLATALGVSGRELRVMLRDHNVEKNENGRYEWPSVEEALEQLGFDDVDDAKEALAESRAKRLEALKEKVAASREAEGDDEEEEDEAPPPKKKKKRKK